MRIMRSEHKLRSFFIIIYCVKKAVCVNFSVSQKVEVFSVSNKKIYSTKMYESSMMKSTMSMCFSVDRGELLCYPYSAIAEK